MIRRGGSVVISDSIEISGGAIRDLIQEKL
jgi:hypothetical protein